MISPNRKILGSFQATLLLVFLSNIRTKYVRLSRNLNYCSVGILNAVQA